MGKRRFCLKQGRFVGGIVLTLFVMTVLLSISCRDLHAEEKAEACRKIVSVVYDDSGSMYESGDKAVDRWAQANYAMQSFAALLNDQDQMYITYMSDADRLPEKNGLREYSFDTDKIVTVDMQDVAKSVNKIRKKTDKGATPVQALEAAMDKLSSIQDPNETTQYWLVVLTDGDMYVNEKKGKPFEKADVQKKLNGYVGQTMPNGSSVYITYLGIGDNLQPIKGNPSEGFDARNTTDIVDALSEIANKVSGRNVFKDADIKTIDDKTIQLHTDIPLYSISVFSQRSKAEVKEIRTVSTVRNIGLKYPKSPKPNKYITNEKLYGNATLAKNSNGSLIQPGDYELVFTDKVSLKNTVFMYQPAIKMVPSISKNGAKLKIKSLEKKLKDGDSIDIELIPTNPETGDPIPDNLLPKGISWSIDYLVEGKQKEHSDDRILRKAKVGTGENKIVCVMKIPDMTPQNDIYVFVIDKPVAYDFKIDGDATRTTFKRGKMGKNNYIGNPISMNVTADGVPLDDKTMRKVDFSISDVTLDDSKVSGSFFETSGWRLARTATGKLKDGSFTVYPRWSLLPFLIKPGEYNFKIKATLPDGTVKEAEASYTVIGHWKDWLAIFVLLGIIALFLYIVVGLIIMKPKFAGQHIVVRVYESDGGSGGILDQQRGCSENLHSFRSLKDFTPLPSTAHPGNIKVVAAPGSGVMITAGTLKNYLKYGTSVRRPTRQFSKLVESLSSVTKGKKDRHATGITDVYLGNESFYLLNSAGLLYEITLVD